MASVNISPNMLLPVPVPTVDLGPDWANQIYTCLYSQLDAHDHSSGKGVQITPAGININGPLSFGSNSATNLLTSSYASQSAALSGSTYPAAVYVAGGELFYNDLVGNQVKITAGGAVNATSSGISSGTATASFVASVLVVNAAANTPANIQVGSVLLGNNVANSKYLTLSPPNAMAANYSLVLPALPSVPSFMQLDASGNMSASVAVSQGITGSNMANGTVTRLQEAAVGQTVSGSSGTFSINTLTPTNVTNLSTTLTTSSSNRPVIVALIGDGSANNAFIGAVNGTNTQACSLVIYLLRGATILAQYPIQGAVSNGTTTESLIVPPSTVYFIDTFASPSSNYTYSVKVASANSGTLCEVFHCALVTYEL